MNLPREDVRLFSRLYSELMFFANGQLRIVEDPFTDAGAYDALPPESRTGIRNALHETPELIDQFIRENPASLPTEELEIVAGWRHAIVGKFYVFRYLKRHTIFLSSGGSPNRAYGVLGLFDPVEELVGTRLPVLTDAVLLAFRDRIIYDGILSVYNVTFGGGVRKMLNEEYKEAKQAFGIITSLGDEVPPPHASERPKKKESAKIQRRLEDVLEMIPCPIAGCWSFYGAQTAYYFDDDRASHVLEVWPLGHREPFPSEGNGHPPCDHGVYYESAEFDFTDLVREVALKHFHFSQQRALFEIGWTESGRDLELRIHIEPEEVAESTQDE